MKPPFRKGPEQDQKQVNFDGRAGRESITIL
jgi:hypothetical protein